MREELQENFALSKKQFETGPPFKAAELWTCIEALLVGFAKISCASKRQSGVLSSPDQQHHRSHSTHA